MKLLPGQVDTKSLITTLVGAAILAATAALWSKAEAGEEALRICTGVEKRMGRLEDMMERVIDPRPVKPPRR